MPFSLRITTIFLFYALCLTTTAAQNCTPSTLVTVRGDNPAYEQYLNLFKGTGESTQPQITQILADIEQCNRAAVAEQSNIVRSQKDLINQSQKLQECTNIEELQKAINKLEESKKEILKAMKSSIEKVKFSGIYGVILNNINTRTDFNVHTTQCDDAITLEAVENLVGTQIRRATTVENFSKVTDVINTYKAGAMQVTEGIFQSPQTTTRCFFYIVEFSISPKEPKNNNGQRSFEHNANATVLDLFNTPNWRNQFMDKGADAVILNEKQGIIENRRGFIQRDNKSAEEELQNIAQNAARDIKDIDNQIISNQKEIARKIKKITTIATELKIQIDEKQPMQALKKILNEMNTRILALGKQWQVAKNKEIKSRSGVAQLHANPNESLAKTTIELCNQLKTTYEPVRYNFETIDVENFKTTNFKQTNTRVFSHRLTQSWSYPVPNDATFMLYVLARFEVVEGSNLPPPPTPDDIEMVFIQGGTFQMGCTSEQNDCGSDETVHSVTISDYYIGKYEVTQAQWDKIMGSNPSTSNKGDKYPVEDVSWNEIQDFLQKLNTKTGKKYSLPTEAQWEYAARGGEGYQYAGSNTLDDVAWNDSNSDGKTDEVGGRNPNGYGLYDMSGNVWEWCSDVYGPYTRSSLPNPKGASIGSYRVIRGGGWSHPTTFCRVAYRFSSAPTNSYSYWGFRLALYLSK
jgi:formylglycine-generating enzyme required for sulfatase activity